MSTLKYKTQEMNSLAGHLLVAMPNMKDARFIQTVIYLCAHSKEGAMGIILNKKTDMRLLDILTQLNLLPENEHLNISSYSDTFPIRYGGPVEPNRGFVLHSDDYTSLATTSVENHVSLTATLDVLKAIGEGKGPKNVIVALGYAGWDAGQLETEIAENSWLISKGAKNLIFTNDLEKQYDDVLNDMGVDPNFLSREAGNA